MNTNRVCVLLLAVLVCSAEAYEEENKGSTAVDARGSKYALLTNLAILLAAKVGLFKICLGIALVIGSMKFLVILAWALAIFKYIPDPYIYYDSHQYKKSQFHFDPYDHHQYGHDRIRYDPLSYLHFIYVVATKLFVLKIIYGAIFYALIVKGWHFLNWFIHYLKEKKAHQHHEYIEYAHEPYHDHYEHGHGNDPGYGHHSYGPYAYDKHGYESKNDFKHKNNIMYDADGSYSVRS